MTVPSAVLGVVGFFLTSAVVPANGQTPIRTNYLGGSRMDAATSVAVDSAGYLYVAGWTESADLPVHNAYQTRSRGGVDAFVAKITPDRSAFVYCTYLGGSGDDRALSVAVDGSGNAYVAGATTSADFPAVNAYQRRSAGGKDVFVVKLNSGGAVVYATYFGGRGSDTANAVTVDGAGDVFITGSTDSADFPVRNAAQSTFGGVQDAFVFELDAFGSLAYSTYIGGTLADAGSAIAIDKAGCVYITGWTESRDFPTASPFQPALGGGTDAFVTELAPAGDRFVFSSFLGGSGGSFTSIPEYGSGIAVNAAGEVFVTGVAADRFPVTVPTSTARGGFADAFVAKIAKAGSGIVFARYLGGRSDDFATGITLSGSGRLLICGYTRSPDFPGFDGAPLTGLTGYLAIIETNGQLAHTARLQADADVRPFGIAARAGLVYLAGETGSTSLPAPGPLGARLSGLTDGFLAESGDPSFAGGPYRYVPITPCRLLDTRGATGPYGGPAMAANSTRDISVSGGGCGVPAKATAYSINVAVVPLERLGFLTVWPTQETMPGTATLNSDDRVRSTATIVGAGVNGAVTVYTKGATHLILDINGYFVPADDPAGLAFFPITPCRVFDTRRNSGPLGAPFLSAAMRRTLPILSGNCSIPTSARAYALNLAAIPKQPLFVTAWPSGQSQPGSASLNAVRLIATSNAAIVPAGTAGAIDLSTSGDTDLVIDVEGYFAPMDTGGLSLYTVPLCRILDTRLGPAAQPFSGTRDVNASVNSCLVAPQAQAFVFYATVVPAEPLGFITLWPRGTTQPEAACLNAKDGSVTGNMAIVRANEGFVSAFASQRTDLILDLLGYWAP